MLTIPALYACFKASSKVNTDSRTIGPGELYFALRGPRFDGNAFALQALEKGAAYAVVDRDFEGDDDPRILRVEDSEASLQALASYHRSQWEGTLLAITGSNGKTTTKELIYRVLSTQYPTQATVGNLNNHIGVPLTLLSLKPETRFAVVEMGANHRGEIAQYCQWAKPDYGLITNCGKAHLEGFGSPEGVKAAKGELYDAIRQGEGKIFLHVDLPYLVEMAQGIPDPITYGQGDALYRGKPLVTDLYLRIALLSRGMERSLDTQLVGAYNFGNVMAALAVGLHFGIPLDLACEAIATYAPGNSRSQYLKKGGHQIVLDAYNANPSSMELAIRHFAQWAPDPKLVLLGSMKELGKDSRKEHEKLVEELRAHDWAQVIFIGSEYEGLTGAYPCFPTIDEAIHFLKELKLPASSVLIKGSRAHQMERLLEVF